MQKTNTVLQSKNIKLKNKALYLYLKRAKGISWFVKPKQGHQPRGVG